jgi:hypothetical protein
MMKADQAKEQTAFQKSSKGCIRRKAKRKAGQAKAGQGKQQQQKKNCE